MNKSIDPICIDGPLMVFGGPYSNLEATQALLKQAAASEIPPIASFAPEMLSLIALIQWQRLIWCVTLAATLSWAIANRAWQPVRPIAVAGFQRAAPANACLPPGFHAVAELGHDALSWMAALPRRIDIEIGGNRLAVVHGGSPVSINSYSRRRLPKSKRMT
jgi:hypothetical protein